MPVTLMAFDLLYARGRRITGQPRNGALSVDGSPAPKATTALFMAATQIVIFREGLIRRTCSLTGRV